MDEQAEIPETDAESGGFDRRKLLRGAAMAGAAAWVVPSVISLTASPAMASGGPPLITGNGGSNSLVNATSATVPGSMGVLVATLTLHGNLTGTGNVGTITPTEAGWTAQWTHGTDSEGDPLTVVTYTRLETTVATRTYDFTWTGVACACSLVITGFTHATVVDDSSGSGNPATPSTTVSAPVVTVGTPTNITENRGVLWVTGYATDAEGFPGLTGPTGFTTTLSDFKDAVATRHKTAPFPVTPGSFGPQTATLGTAQFNVAGMIVVY